MDAARKPVSEEEAEDIITEAMRSVRPGYRPISEAFHYSVQETVSGLLSVWGVRNLHRAEGVPDAVEGLSGG